MRVKVTILVLLVVFLCCSKPTFSSSSCSLWPRPNNGTAGIPSFTVDTSLQLTVSGQSSPILDTAIKRYHDLIFYKYPGVEENQRQFQFVDNENDFPVMSSVQISVQDPSAPLQFGVDESYTLDLASPQGKMTAATPFGAMRGLETLSQLIDYDVQAQQYVACNASISDKPKYPLRGLLIDTSRHYQPLRIIKNAIDGLAYSKMNTLHWHIVDSQSFPLETKSYPELAKSAWAPEAIYTLSDVSEIVQYGLERGVRVVIEVDMPGHSESWPKAMPELALTDCALVNPVLNETFDVINGILGDLATVTVDDFVHLGGDEVNYECWLVSKEVWEWLLKHGEVEPHHVYQYFLDRVHEITQTLRTKTVIHWQEVFDKGIDVPKDTSIIHVWKDAKDLKKVTAAGYRGMMSYGWYLDHIWDTWEIFYLNPLLGDSSLEFTEDEAAAVIGGEACMWGETVDENNFNERVWPRTAATGERLWANDLGDVLEAKPRLVAHQCRLVRRGIHSSPITPSYCPW